MKNLNFLEDSFQKLTLMVVMLLSSIYAIAQDSANSNVSTTTTTTTTTEEWYANPLYLIIGIAVLILIIVLVSRGKKLR